MKLSGGYKGYGLGVMVEMFAGLLSGATLSPDARHWNDRGNVAGLVCDGNNHFYLTIIIKFF